MPGQPRRSKRIAAKAPEPNQVGQQSTVASKVGKKTTSRNMGGKVSSVDAERVKREEQPAKIVHASKGSRRMRRKSAKLLRNENERQMTAQPEIDIEEPAIAQEPTSQDGNIDDSREKTSEPGEPTESGNKQRVSVQQDVEARDTADGQNEQALNRTTKSSKRKRDESVEPSRPAKRRRMDVQQTAEAVESLNDMQNKASEASGGVAGNSDTKGAEHAESAVPGERQTANTEEVNDAQTPKGNIEEQDTPQSGSPPSHGLDKKFLKTLISVIFTSRALRQKQAEQDKIRAELMTLDCLLNFSRRHLLDVPAADEYRQARDDLHDEVRTFERHQAQREASEPELDLRIGELIHEQEARKARLGDFDEELQHSSMPQCLKDSTEFQDSYEQCRQNSGKLKGIELELEAIVQERNAVFGGLDDEASVLAEHLNRAVQPAAEATAAEKEVSEGGYLTEEDAKKGGEQLARREELQRDRNDVILELYWHKELLARHAEKALVDAGFLPPSKYALALPVSETDTEGQQGANKSNADPAEHPPHENESPPAQEARSTPPKRDLRAELVAAQDHYYKSKDEFDDCRKLSEEEIEQLPHPDSESEQGDALFKKLDRKTRELKEAEENLKLAERAARDAGIINRFPIDQTWGFEKRPNDGVGCTDEEIIARFEPRKHHVDGWVSKLPTSGKRTPPTSVHGGPGPYDPPQLIPLVPLGLGHDWMEGVPHGRWRQRIDDYRRECEVLRQSGQFPLSMGDPFIMEDGSMSMPNPS